MLERLLKYPHAAVFDPSPAPELALRIRNPVGLVWTIENRVLRLVVGQDAEWDGTIEWNGNYDFGLTSREYGLDDKTVGELVDALRADGHEVVFENPEMAGLGASVLIAGSGDQYASNGDHLNGYTSLLWVMLDAYAGELGAAQYQSGQALRQMVMTQAEGEWLDVWAGIYGVPRLGSEADAALQARIPQEVFRLRVNGLAIEQAITDVAGETVAIDEPWRRMFLLDVSALSGAHHMQDGRYYTYHVIQPVGVEGTSWSKAYPVIERNKAAGIEIYPPRIDFPAWEVRVQPPVEYRIERGQMDMRGAGIWGTRDQILGVMRLSDNEITINHLVSQHHWAILSEDEGLQTLQQIEPHRTIAMAAIALSEGPESGSENFVLGRGAQSVSFDPEPVPSELMYLSGYDAETIVERVERITIMEHAYDAGSTFTATGVEGRTDTYPFSTNEAYLLREWAGGWDAARWVPDWRNAGMVMTSESA